MTLQPHYDSDRYILLQALLAFNEVKVVLRGTYRNANDRSRTEKELADIEGVCFKAGLYIAEYI